MRRLRRLSLSCALFCFVTPAAISTQAVTETAHVVVTGGANAGTYDASPTKGGCSLNLAAPDAWGSTFDLTDPDPKRFSSLWIVVPDSKAAAQGVTEFWVNVGFGPLLHRTGYEIQTRTDVSVKNTGSGTITVTDHGATVTMTFSGQTAAGVKLAGTVECKSVYRNPG